MMFSRSIGVVAAVLLIACSGCAPFRWVYEAELRDVKHHLETIPGVTVKKVWGTEDITLEHICAVIELADRTEAMIGNLTASSFEPGGSFALFYVGRQSPRYTTFGYQGAYETATGRPVRGHAYGYTLAFGSSGVLEPFIPVRIATVQDLVQQARTVEAALAAWPRCPSYSNFDEPGGLRYRFCAGPPEGSKYPPDFE